MKVATARSIAIWKPVEATSGSAGVVQLGAYSSRESASAGWTTLVRRNDALGRFPVVRSEAIVGGRQFYRVAIAGFSDRAGAERVCAGLRARGSACFVRQGGAEAAPSRWAKAMKPAQLAMR
jgi:cell division septation protein DedD